MLRDFEVRRWISGQGCDATGRLVDVSVNDLEDRRVWFAPGVGFVKQYAATAADRYRREVRIFAADVPGFGRPGLIASEDMGPRGSLILIDTAPGTILDQVYLDLSESDYVNLARALGQALGYLHSAPIPAEVGRDTLISPLPEARLRDRLSFERNVTDLALSGALADAEASGLRAGMARLPKDSETIWADSREGWIHGDVHNENVFYGLRDSEVSLVFIDFEEASIAPVEVDLVHPFLNILGEAFPGREFGDERGAGHPIFEAFFSAYGETGPRQVGLGDIAPHAIAWYLGIARDADKAGMAAASFYLDTALAVASLLGWVSGRNENGAPDSEAP